MKRSTPEESEITAEDRAIYEPLYMKEKFDVDDGEMSLSDLAMSMTSENIENTVEVNTARDLTVGCEEFVEDDDVDVSSCPTETEYQLGLTC